MRIRLTALTLGLYLSFVLLGCNKPAAPADSSSSSTSSPSSSDNSNGGNMANSSSSGGSGSAMSNTANVEHETRGREAFGGPSGHRIDGSPGTIGWL